MSDGNRSSLLRKFGITLLKHLVVVVIMLGCCFVLVPDAFEGKVIMQGDKLHSLGMKRDVKAHYERTGELTNWTDRSYCGMPTTLIYPVYPNNWASALVNSLENWTHPQLVHLMLPMLCLYIALVVAGYPIWLSLLGALSFGLSTINVGNMIAAHSSKIKSIATAIPILIGVYLMFEKKILRGFLLMTVFGALHLATNHLQITYYALLGGLVIFFVGGFRLIRSGEAKLAIKLLGLTIVALIIGVGPNISMLWSNYAYTKDSVRGERILKSSDTKVGLDREYAYVFSHDFLEMFSLILPRVVGGSNHELVDKDSESYQYMKKTGLQGSRISGSKAVVPLFWGEKPINESPTYLGIVVFALFILGLLFATKRLRVTVGVVLLLYFVIALGDNAGFLNELMYKYVPLFARFRAPSMVLGLAVGLMAWISVDGLSKVIEKPKMLESHKKLLVGLGSGIAICYLFFAVLGPTVFDFSWDYGVDKYGFGIDESFKNQLVRAGNQVNVVEGLMEAIRSDRASVMRSDAIRGLFFLSLVIAAIAAMMKNSIRPKFIIPLIGLLCLMDLIPIAKDYTEQADFEKTTDLGKSYPPDEADLSINRMMLAYDRVLDLTTSTMQDGRPSYYFNNIGGNHAAKLRRYQDLIERHLNAEIQGIRSASRQADVPVLNMLNARFFKVGSGSQNIRENLTANGFAWFVDSVAWVNSPDREIESLGGLRRTDFAVVDKSFRDKLISVKNAPSQFSKIELTSKSPGEVKYLATTDKTKLLVMSEIWYQGNNYWTSFIDDEPTEHLRVNYLLRGIVVPSGTHEIRFEYSAIPFERGEKYAAIGSGLWLMSIAVSLFLALKRPID